MLRNWNDLPTSTKKKWRDKTSVILTAVEREADRVQTIEDQKLNKSVR